MHGVLQAGKVWGLAGSVLALETLQRALNPGNRARSLLVGAALAAGLVPALLAKLDWRAHSSQRPGEDQVRPVRLLVVHGHVQCRTESNRHM